MNAQEAREYKAACNKKEEEEEEDKKVTLQNGVFFALKELRKRIKQDPTRDRYTALTTWDAEENSDIWNAVKADLVEKGYEISAEPLGVDAFSGEATGTVMYCKFTMDREVT